MIESTPGTPSSHATLEANATSNENAKVAEPARVAEPAGASSPYEIVLSEYILVAVLVAALLGGGKRSYLCSSLCAIHPIELPFCTLAAICGSS